MSDGVRYRLDDLRRFASALGAGVGLAPARATALAVHLLWFDAAGAPSFGIAALPDWLDRIASGGVDPAAEGSVVGERAAIALFDGQNGVTPLLLARAGELAIEKARDAGVGLVRVGNVGPSGPAARVAGEMAIGPMVGLVLGPSPSLAVALPSEEGLPAVYDSTLGGAEPAAWAGVAPWLSVLAPEGGWIVAAISVAALEPLATFQERVRAMLGGTDRADAGRSAALAPTPWEAHRREARERGVEVTEGTWSRLRPWAERSRVAVPEPSPKRP